MNIKIYYQYISNGNKGTTNQVCKRMGANR